MSRTKVIRKLPSLFGSLALFCASSGLGLSLGGASHKVITYAIPYAFALVFAAAAATAFFLAPDDLGITIKRAKSLSIFADSIDESRQVVAEDCDEVRVHLTRKPSTEPSVPLEAHPARSSLIR